MPESLRMARGEREQEPQDPERVTLVLALPGEQRQPQQAERRRRAA